MGIHGMKNNEFKTICVFMQKGGVGKTTLTTMISYELAKYGKVLVVDADQQGNFTYLYDPEGEKVSSKKCFLSVLKEETSLKDGLIECRPEAENFFGLYLLGTKKNDNDLRSYMESGFRDDPQAIRTIIREAKELNFNYVLFDLPPSFGFYEKIILSNANNILPIIEPEDFAVESLTNFNSQIKKLTNINDVYNTIRKDNYRLIKDIFIEIDNIILGKIKDIDVNMSGATCYLLIQLGDNLISANIGNSKAIIVKNDKISKTNQVIPLSLDCRLDIFNEHKRILDNGGIIKKLRDYKDVEYGPLRAFICGTNLPGLPYSRSFGDKLGKNIGIIAEPLIKEYNLNKDIKYIIMASNGIWEGMKIHEINELANKYYALNDPDSFCKETVKISSSLSNNSLLYNGDITIIVIFFSFL